jgi:hypothetical protein
MAGGRLTGRAVKAAYARSNTWGVPASVTKQLWLEDTSGLDTQVGMVDDPSFNQTFLLAGDVGDHMPSAKGIGFALRYETVDVFLAAAMGSASAPVVVSSQASNSLVAYSHTVSLAQELTHYLTLAVDETNYVLEVPTMKLAGYSIKVGTNGRMLIEFAAVGAKTNYASTVNTNSTVAGAVAPPLGMRLFRKDGVFRMNLASGNSLVAADALSVMDISMDTKQPLSDKDYVFGQNYIIEPDNNGFPDFPLVMNFPRMTTIAANSLVLAYQAGTVFKGDWTFTGPFINSTSARSMLFQFPALQIYSWAAPVVGANQVKPTATVRMKQSLTVPLGMPTTLAMQLVIVNANSLMLLT